MGGLNLETDLCFKTRAVFSRPRPNAAAAKRSKLKMEGMHETGSEEAVELLIMGAGLVTGCAFSLCTAALCVYCLRRNLRS